VKLEKHTPEREMNPELFTRTPSIRLTRGKKHRAFYTVWRAFESGRVFFQRFGSFTVQDEIRSSPCSWFTGGLRGYPSSPGEGGGERGRDAEFTIT